MKLLYYGGRSALLGCCLALNPLSAAGWGHGNFEQKQDRAWKRYHNAAYGYCVSIPSRWVKGEAFEGAGLYVEAGNRATSRPAGAIDFEAIATSQDDARSLPVSLTATWEDHVAGLQKFERAERMEILEKREETVQGYPALFVKHRYYDPQERATWIEEVVFVNHDRTIYRFELACKASQIERFAAVFERLLDSVSFGCAGAN